MSKIMVPNKLGWVTSVEMHHTDRYVDVTAFGDSLSQYIPSQPSLEMNLTMQAIPTLALHELVQSWFHDGIYMPTFQKEFMCLWCGSPNSIEHTHCRKCGAPRSFVVG